MTVLTSISENMSAEEIIAEIKMERQSFKGVFLLMEGGTDARRFDKFLDEQNTSTVVCWGKKCLKESFLILESDNIDGYLGLLDSDFDKLLKNKIISENIIYSEFHDFDLDMASTNVLNRYLSEMGDEKKCADAGGQDGIIEHILKTIEPLSKIKYSNARGLCNYSISKINWDNCYDGNAFNLDKFIFKILKKSTPTASEIKDFRVSFVESHPEPIDLLQLTNGHDFFIALGKCLLEKIGSRRKPLTEGKEIERHLRLAFNYEDFKSMQLYNSLTKWSQKYSKVVLASRLN